MRPQWWFWFSVFIFSHISFGEFNRIWKQNGNLNVQLLTCCKSPVATSMCACWSRKHACFPSCTVQYSIASSLSHDSIRTCVSRLLYQRCLYPCSPCYVSYMFSRNHLVPLWNVLNFICVKKKKKEKEYKTPPSLPSTKYYSSSFPVPVSCTHCTPFSASISRKLCFLCSVPNGIFIMPTFLHVYDNSV